MDLVMMGMFEKDEAVMAVVLGQKLELWQQQHTLEGGNGIDAIIPNLNGHALYD